VGEINERGVPMSHSVIETMIRHIGRGDLLATSGGRYTYDAEAGVVVLPVASGYSVRVTYCAVPDLYRVERVYRRGLKEWVKGCAEGVYADHLGEMVYRAGCFRDAWAAGGAA